MATATSDWELLKFGLSTPGFNVGAYGIHGTSKTTTGQTVPFKDQQEVEPDYILNVTMSPGTDEGVLLGRQKTAMSDEWLLGYGLRAWKLSWEKPVRLIINEIDDVQDTAESALMVITENPRSASTYYDTENGERLRPHPTQFQVYATMNSHPSDLRPALRDRISWVEITTVNEDALLGLPESLRNYARETCNQKPGDNRLSLRDWYAYAALLETHGPEHKESAAALAFGPKRYRDILAGIKMAGVASKPVRKPTTPIKNDNYNKKFSSWRSFDKEDDVVWCEGCKVEGKHGSHAGINCWPLNFSSESEAVAFQSEYSCSTTQQVYRYSLIYRSHDLTPDAVVAMATTWKYHAS